MSSPKTYFHSADLLRGLTALLIAIYHFVSHSDANGTLFEEESVIVSICNVLPSSVFIFFSLSGFVIAVSMHRNAYQLNKIGLFLARRWVRIQVPYIASIIVYVLISVVWSLKKGSALDFEIQRVLHHLIYTVPFTEYEWYNQIYWTLAIEFQFYLLIALLFPLIFSKKLVLRYAVLGVFMAAGILFPENRFVFRYAPMFVFGVLTYLHFYSGEKSSFIALLIMVLSLIQISVYFDLAAVLFILGSTLLMPLSISPKNLFCRFGKMGYSYYLIHGAAGGTLLYFLSKEASSFPYKLLIIVAAILASFFVTILFYRLVEVPSIKISRQIDFSSKNKTHE